MPPRPRKDRATSLPGRRPSSGRTELLTVTMTPAELAQAHGLARAAGTTTADYVRTMLAVRAAVVGVES